MKSEVVVKVFLVAKGKDPPPKGGAIEFNYALDTTLSDKYVSAELKGDLYVGNANQRKTTLIFALQDKTLVWNGKIYNVTLAPTKNQPLGAAEMIYISLPLPFGTSPSVPWPAGDLRFTEFKEAKNPGVPGWDALQVTFDRDLGTVNVFPYSLAVNVSDSQNNFVATVRDDPLIKDRGVPSAPFINDWLVAVVGLLAGMVITFLTMNHLRPRARPGSS